MPSKLAKCAFELFSLRGIDEVTIDDIAARAEVTKGSFYSHYSSKQEVIYAACDHYYCTYLEAVHLELSKLKDPAQRLAHVLEYSVRSCVVDRGNRVFTTEIFTLLQKDKRMREDWAEFYDTVREMYLDLLVAAQKEAESESADPRQAVDLMLTAMEGIKMRASFEPEIEEPEQQRGLVEGLWKILFGSSVELCGTRNNHEGV